MADEIKRITAERVQAELSKLILGSAPRKGIELMVDTGLADHVLPEVPGMRLAIDEHHQHKDVYQHSLKVLEQAIDLETAHEPRLEPDLVLRLAACCTTSASPRRRFEPGGGVTTPEVVGAKWRASVCVPAVPEGRRQRRVPTGVPAPAVPRLRPG